MKPPNKTVRLIRSVYESIPELPTTMIDPIGKLRTAMLQAEREHRAWSGGPYRLSCDDAAQYFTAIWLHRYASGSHKLPSLSDALDLKPAVVTAAMLTARHRTTLRRWAKTVPAEFVALDYCRMVRP